MTSVEMCILKGFNRFVLSFDVQNGFVYDSFSFDHYIEESNLVLWYFGREFDARVEFVSLFNKMIQVFFITVPEGEDVVNISSPFFLVGFALLFQF